MATDDPVAAVEMARVTDGIFFPVSYPGDIIRQLSHVPLANIDDVAVVNLTIGGWAGAGELLLRLDGSFAGFVPVCPGLNRIEVSAVDADGNRGSAEFETSFRRGAPATTNRE